MIERLHYNLDESFRMTLDAPQAVFETALAKTRLGETLERPKSQVVVHLEEGDGGVRLILNTKRVGNTKNPIVQDDRSKQLVYAFASIDEYTPMDQHDENMHVRMGTKRINGGDRFNMSAELRWPMLDDRLASAVATTEMRQVALDLKHVGKSIIDSVYADVSRERGVTLESLDMGSCSLDTDGMHYSPDDETVKLVAHNIYNHRIQLICLSGLIALARL